MTIGDATVRLDDGTTQTLAEYLASELHDEDVKALLPAMQARFRAEGKCHWCGGIMALPPNPDCGAPEEHEGEHDGGIREIA